MRAFETLPVTGIRALLDADQAVQWVYDELKVLLFSTESYKIHTPYINTWLSTNTGESVDLLKVMTDNVDADGMAGWIHALINDTVTTEQAREIATWLTGNFECEIRATVERENKELSEWDYSAQEFDA